VSGLFGVPLRKGATLTSRVRHQPGTTPADDGFTLIELLAALVVTSIAFTALAGALISGLAATSTTASTTAATQLASERVEALRTVKWDKLGHYADEAAWGTGLSGGESLVQVAATTPNPRPAGVPALATESVTRGGVTYAVTTRVTWKGSSSAAPNDGTTYAQKRMDVTVTWTLRGQTRTVTQEALRAPTANEMRPPVTATGTPIGLSNQAATPNQTLDANGLLAQAVTLRVDTSIAAQTVSASYLLASGDPASIDLTEDATARFWTATLPVGTGPFAAGSATFTFTATHSSGSTGTAIATVQLSAPVVTFALNNAAATTSNSQLAIGALLAAPIALSVKSSTAASSVQATYPLSGGTTSAPIVFTYSAGTNSWNGEIPLGAGPVTPGNLTVTFSGTSSTGTNATTTASVTLQAPTLGAIAINKPTVVPDFCSAKTSPFRLKRNSVVTVEVMNVDATGTAVTTTLAGQTARSATALGTTGPSGGQLFRVTYTTTTAINATSINLTVNVTRQADSATATGTWAYPVIQKNGNAC
jgi:prepilin-type N-terminal cleavage/methylation domain-containing protein